MCYKVYTAVKSTLFYSFESTSSDDSSSESSDEGSDSSEYHEAREKLPESTVQHQHTTLNKAFQPQEESTSVPQQTAVQLPAVQVDSTKPGGLQPHRWQSELITHDATKGFHFTCTQAVFFNCTCVGVCSASRRRAWWPWTSQEKLEDGSSRIRWRPSVQSGRRDRPGG